MFTNWINFTIDPLVQTVWVYEVTWTGVFLAHYKINIGYYIRKVLKIKQTKGIKLLDCYPCQSFWVALIVTLNPLTAGIIYFMAQATTKD